MICIDIDGVIGDFGTAYLDYISSIIDVSDYTIKSWNFIHELEVEYGVQLPSLEDFFDSKYALSMPTFDDVEVLNEINPILLTSRPLSSRKVTEQWLALNNIKYSKLVYSTDKLDYILRNDIKLFVDDNPKEIITQAYCTFLLMDRLYNQHVEADRVHNLKEVLKCFKNYMKK